MILYLILIRLAKDQQRLLPVEMWEGQADSGTLLGKSKLLLALLEYILVIIKIKNIYTQKFQSWELFHKNKNLSI